VVRPSELFHDVTAQKTAPARDQDLHVSSTCGRSNSHVNVSCEDGPYVGEGTINMSRKATNDFLMLNRSALASSDSDHPLS
jgi:hypothetical protein